MQVFAIVLAVMVGVSRANVDLPDGWTLDATLPYGKCTNTPISGEYRTGPPYTGANADPYIAEAVGSGSRGITCSFEEKHASYLPPAWRNHYLLAASQDLYAGFHLPVCEGCSEPNSLWDALCQPHKISRASAEAGTNMCSATCGECFLITGYETNRSAIFIVNEISDVGCCGQAGRGLEFNLDGDRVNEVRGWSGFSKDIRWRRVPCPTDSGMRILVSGRWGDTAIFLTVLNHAVGVATLAARGGPGSGQTEWVPLVRDWVNRWRWESYGCDTCISWQTTPIHGGSTNKDYELRITSRDGQVVYCYGLDSAASADTVMACVDANGDPVQFGDVAGVDPRQACDGSYVDPDGGGNGLSPGAVAALVIVFLVLPVCIAGAVVAWVVYRKKKQLPIVPESAKTKWTLFVEKLKRTKK